MAKHQPASNFNPNHTGENDTGIQSAGSSHPAQHAEGVKEGTVARGFSNQIPEPHESWGFIGWSTLIGHLRVDFKPTHTCATCKETHPNNYALEQHASKARHKAFLCTCTTKFVRLATLNRHIAAQAGPKHHCDYCDDNKGFARSDKLIDHLRASHKFGEKAIARIRGQGGDQPGNLGLGVPMATTADLALPATTSAGHDAALDHVMIHQAGPSAGPADFFDGGLNNFHSLNAEEFQPFNAVMDYPWLDAAGAFTGVDEDLDSFMVNNN